MNTCRAFSNSVSYSRRAFFPDASGSRTCGIPPRRALGISINRVQRVGWFYDIMPDMPHATLKPFPHHRICRLVIAWLACLVLATFSSAQQPDTAKPSAYDPVAVPSVHLHNVWRLSPRIISGSEPDSKEAFEELQQLKVTCIMASMALSPGSIGPGNMACATFTFRLVMTASTVTLS